MKLLALALIATLCIAGCSNPPQAANTPPNTPVAEKGTDIPGLSAYTLGQPVTSGNVTIVPVSLKETPKWDDDYATLAEAKKNGWVEIVEIPGEREVNRLQVRNNGPKPLLLLGGELLIGGKQDRIVAHDTVVPAGKTVFVEVYCVEHGRWDGPTTKFSSADTAVPMSVREQATYGGQQQVWDKVSDYNAKAAPNAAKTTIMEGLSSKEVRGEISTDSATILDGLKNQKNVVGAVIVINGEIKNLELFGTPKLFDASFNSLLNGVIAEGVINKGGTPQTLNLQDCSKFVADALSGRRKLKSSDTSAQGFELADGSNVRGREIANHDYEAKPMAGSSGLLHGTYSNEKASGSNGR